MKNPADSLVAQLIGDIHARIASRLLMPGAKLPSIRAQAAARGISTTTVVEAYDRLVAEGVIESRRGAGFYVLGHPPPFNLAATNPKLERSVDPLWVSRQSLETPDHALRPGCGWLPPTWMPEAILRRSMRTLSRADTATLTDYGSLRGHLKLRDYLARRLNNFGVPAAPEQILLVDSGTQALDLLCRFLLDPGDTVLLDDPCYFNFRALLLAHRVNVVGVPYTPTGPDVTAFANILARTRPRLYITNCAVHNPTGASFTAPIAHRTLKLAEEYGVIVIEDDIFADFEAEPSPRLAAFDGLERVIQIGSFSKTISASLRCGYIVAKPEWIEGLEDLKIATSFSSGGLSAALLLAVLKDGAYRKHMEALRTKLALLMSRTISHLQDVGITPWVIPRAGMHLWCALPEGIDASQIARHALTQNIVLAPGNVFSPEQAAPNFLRFNVAQSQDPRIFQFFREHIKNFRLID